MKSKKTLKIEITLETEDLVKALAKEHDVSPEQVDGIEIIPDGTGIKIRGIVVSNTKKKENDDESK